ncbi:MAG: hypothetical protein ACP5XB_02885 [Isosphaeraceae bacterium]
MKSSLQTRPCLIAVALCLACWPGQKPLRARSAEDGPASVEFLERPGQPRLQGRLALQAGAGLTFIPGGDVQTGQPLVLQPGAVVSFQRPPLPPATIPPLFHVSVGLCARISGLLREVTDKGVILSAPWRAEPIRVARPGVQAILQRPGEASIFADGFRRIDKTRWTVEGKPEVETQTPAKAASPRKGLRLPAAGAAVRHRLGEPMVSGRLELSFLDEGAVAADSQFTLVLTFRGSAGVATLRVLLGWAEESLAVESPQGPALAVQRLARSRGWHRLTLRFGTEQTEIAVDGKELAHGKGPPGPLESIGLETRLTGPARGPKDLAGNVGELDLVRFAEPPASLEIDPSQDEVRLVVGDQLYGTITHADAEHVTINVDARPVRLDWSEIAGLHFRRVPAAGGPVEGWLARIEWLAAPAEPNRPREIDHAEGAVTAISDSSITLQAPYIGTLEVPRDRLTRFQVLDQAWQLVLDPSSHHLGDNISTTPPLFDPPQPEGGVLERSFELREVRSQPAFLDLDVLGVVGETSGLPYSNLVQKGELRTYVVVGGKRFDYINRYITTANETPERIQIPIPAGLLKTGKNLIRIEQTGIANNLTWLDDLGILRMSLRFSTTGSPANKRPAGSTTKP